MWKLNQLHFDWLFLLFLIEIIIYDSISGIWSSFNLSNFCTETPLLPLFPFQSISLFCSQPLCKTSFWRSKKFPFANQKVTQRLPAPQHRALISETLLHSTAALTTNGEKKYSCIDSWSNSTKHQWWHLKYGRSHRERKGVQEEWLELKQFKTKTMRDPRVLHVDVPPVAARSRPSGWEASLT